LALTPAASAETNMNLTKTAAADWKPFVANCLVAMTAKKADRELVSGYRVVRSGAMYQIKFGNVAPYAPMTAETLYEWAQRLPLRYFADKADELRYGVMSA
jgi:hypothetical protein